MSQGSCLLERLKAISQGMIVAPITIEIHPTDSCNHDCIWCAARGDRSKRAHMPTPRLLSLIDELAEIGCLEMVFSGGGDPLCHADIGLAIMRAASHGISVELITNGGLIDNGLKDAIVNGCTNLRVSLDAGDCETHRRIHRPRVGGDFSQIITALGDIIDQRQNGRPRVTVSFVLHPDSIDSLSGLLTIADNLGIDAVDIKRDITMDDSDGKQLAALALSTVEWHRKQRPGLRVDFDKHVSRRSYEDGCRSLPWPYLHVYSVINASGDVFPCCHLLANESFCEGNILDEPFQQVWFGRRRRAVIEAAAAGGEHCCVCTHKLPNQLLVKALNQLARRGGGPDVPSDRSG